MQAENSTGALELNHLISSLAMVSNKTNALYPADLISTNLLLQFSLEYVCMFINTYTELEKWITTYSRIMYLTVI